MAFITFRKQRTPMVVLTAALIVFLSLSCIQADTEQSRVKLGPWAGDLKVGPRMNAVGKDLRGCEFVGQDMSGANFDRCDFQDVRIHDCILSNASFRKAKLTGVSLGECNIEGADFTDAIINGIKSSISINSPHDVRLSEQQLISTRSYKIKNLGDCVIYGYDEKGENMLSHYDLRNANLRDVVLIGGDLRECDFTDADISRAEFRSCVITFDQLAATKTFKDGRLREMCFSGAFSEGRADFSGKDLTGTVLYGPLRDANFDGANISRSTLGVMTTERLRTTKNYREGNLSGITLLGTDLSGCDLSRQNLTGCRFTKCDLSGAVFNDAVITDVQFTYKTVGLTLDQIKSTWNYKHARMEGIKLPDDVAEALKKEQDDDP